MTKSTARGVTIETGVKSGFSFFGQGVSFGLSGSVNRSRTATKGSTTSFSLDVYEASLDMRRVRKVTFKGCASVCGFDLSTMNVDNDDLSLAVSGELVRRGYKQAIVRAENKIFLDNQSLRISTLFEIQDDPAISLRFDGFDGCGCKRFTYEYDSFEAFGDPEKVFPGIYYLTRRGPPSASNVLESSKIPEEIKVAAQKDLKDRVDRWFR